MQKALKGLTIKTRLHKPSDNRPEVNCVQIAIGVLVENVESLSQVALRRSAAGWTAHLLAFRPLVFLQQLPKLVKVDATVTCMHKTHNCFIVIYSHKYKNMQDTEAAF